MPGLSDFFTLIAEEKKKQEKEVESLIGDSFEKLFVEQLKTDNKNAVVVLEKELLSLKNVSYSSIDKLMKSICAKYKITAQKLHDDFVKKHGIIPDEWIKKNKNADNKLKSHKTSEELAKKHKVSVSQIEDQLKKGTKVEKEHTKDVELATTIASQHIDELPDYYDRLSKIEKKPIKEGLISEGLLNILPQEKTSDPLTPLNQNFATLDDLQNHYKLFLNRIQQQLSTLGGGGETRLEFLDDIDRNSAKTDNYFLKYDATLNKWIGDPADGVGITSIVSITGVTTYYQANDADDYIGVSANVPVTIVLPQIPSYGKKLVVKDEGNQINTYNITVQAGIGKSVENDISVTMSSNHQSFSFFYNGSNWYIV